MLLTYILILVLPGCTISIASFFMLRDSIKNKMGQSVSGALDQISINIYAYLSNIYERTLVISNLKVIKELLGTQQDGNINRKKEIQKKIEDATKSITAVYGFNNEYTYKIYTENDGISFEMSGLEILSNKEVVNNDWYKHTVDLDGGLYWKGEFNGSNDSRLYLISGCRAIKDYNNSIIGVICVSINFDSIKQIINKAHSYYSSAVILLNEEGDILYANFQDSKHFLSENIRREAMKNDKGYDIINQDGTNLIYNYQRIDMAGWKIVSIIPTSQLLYDIDRIRNVIIVINIITILVFLIITYLLSYSISKPIEELANLMKKSNIDKKGLKYLRRSDEIGDLFNNYYIMMDKIKKLIFEVEESNRQKRSAEIEALQNQINPHFIYNTLNNIQWLAKANRMEDVIDSVASLDKLLRACARIKEELVTIEEELKHVESYLNIQRIRYGDKFDFKFDIDFRILQLKIPMFILQPIVENSIYHGFKEITNGGVIRISVKEENDDILIKIDDNGIGIKEDNDYITSLLNEETKRTDDNAYIGLANVNKRIKLIFGSTYGLNIESQWLKGTSVTILIPLVS